MKHASPETIQALGPLLGQIRQLSGLTEKKPGVYYRKSKAFLHFHEEGRQVFADVRLKQPDFDRFPCTSKKQQRELLARIRQALESG